MRFVPVHKQSDSDATFLSPAKWLVDLVLIANDEGRNQFVDMERVHQIMAPTLRNAYHMTTYQLRFFLITREMRGRPYTPQAERPMRPFLVCAAAISPRTPPVGPHGLPGPHQTPPSQPSRGISTPTDPST